jgi:hypothetical protein
MAAVNLSNYNVRALVRQTPVIRKGTKKTNTGISLSIVYYPGRLLHGQATKTTIICPMVSANSHLSLSNLAFSQI